MVIPSIILGLDIVIFYSISSIFYRIEHLSLILKSSLPGLSDFCFVINDFSYFFGKALAEYFA